MKPGAMEATGKTATGLHLMLTSKHFRIGDACTVGARQVERMRSRGKSCRFVVTDDSPARGAHLGLYDALTYLLTVDPRGKAVAL